MNQLHRELALASTAASLALFSIPAPCQAGPSPGEYTGTVIRNCGDFAPKVARITVAKASVTNPDDPGATFGNKVVVTGRKGRTRVNFESSFTGPDRIQVTLNGRDFAKAPGAPGGKRPRNYQMRGAGPAVVTSSSFGTNNGVGKMGRHRVRFRFNALSIGEIVRVRFDVRAPRSSPVGSRIRFVF